MSSGTFCHAVSIASKYLNGTFSSLFPRTYLEQFSLSWEHRLFISFTLEGIAISEKAVFCFLLQGGMLAEMRKEKVRLQAEIQAQMLALQATTGERDSCRGMATQATERCKASFSHSHNHLIELFDSPPPPPLFWEASQPPLGCLEMGMDLQVLGYIRHLGFTGLSCTCMISARVSCLGIPRWDVFARLGYGCGFPRLLPKPSYFWILGF